SGRTVHVSAATEIEHDNGQVVVGATVEVEGSLQTDGSVKANQIEVKQAAGAGSNFSFTGTVEDLPNTMGRIGDWKVSGMVVHVTAMTMIKQEDTPLAVGVKVEVEGAKRADGSVDAFKIEVDDDMDGNGGIDFKGVIESLPSTMGRIGEWSVSGR